MDWVGSAPFIELGGLLLDALDDSIVEERLDDVDQGLAFSAGEMAKREHGRTGQTTCQHSIQIVMRGDGIVRGHEPEPPLAKDPRLGVEEMASQTVCISLVTVAGRTVLAVSSRAIACSRRR
jgi:hypothetical protein